MEAIQELLRAKEVLKQDRIMQYNTNLKGNNVFEVSVGKFITMEGGKERLWSLQTAYDSIFIDPEVPEVNGNIKQADGSLIDCTLAEWDSLFKLMRAKGKELFTINEVLSHKINTLTDSDSFSKVWNTTWENEVANVS